MKINIDDTMNIYGGDGFSVFAGISAAIAFLISIVDGFLNPRGCGN